MVREISDWEKVGGTFHSRVVLPRSLDSVLFAALCPPLDVILLLVGLSCARVWNFCVDPVTKSNYHE